MAKMNDKDYEILDFIYEQQENNGFPPSVREICDAVHLTSTATVHTRIKKLEDFGFIRKDPLKNRSMQVINYVPEKYRGEVKAETADDRYIDVPVYGKVAAGLPITAVQDDTDTFPLPISFARNKDLFMLKVQGESMIEAAILDGDYIIVEQQPTASNGDIVVALVNGDEATVKTFYKEKGHFRLQPENSSMEPIILNELTILGKVVGVFRHGF